MSASVSWFRLLVLISFNKTKQYVNKSLNIRNIKFLPFRGVEQEMNSPIDEKAPIFPPKTVWDVEGVKSAGLYTWFKEISEELPNGWVVADKQHMLMLGGYSYLGLNKNKAISTAAVDAVQKYGTGMSGSRFLAGTTDLHSNLERRIAQTHKKDSALLYSSGYLANVSTIACLLKSNDYVLCDKLNHASIMDGARYSHAEFIRYHHNDVSHLEELLIKIPNSSRKLVVTDSIFSMSGEPARLPEIIRACKKYNAILMVDECHSMYVLGATGGGITEYFNIDPNDIDIVMATLSKAIPAGGGYVATNEKIVEFLRHESHGFIYSVALSAVMAAAATKALDVFEENRAQLVEKLHDNTAVTKGEVRSDDQPPGFASLVTLGQLRRGSLRPSLRSERRLEGCL